jgi:hypothetical protein
MLGAVNILIDTTGDHQDMSKNLHEHLRGMQRMLVEGALATFTIEDVRKLIREIELKIGRQAPRILH